MFPHRDGHQYGALMNWEYQIITCDTLKEAIAILNREGRDRWECFTFNDDRSDGGGFITLVFKRQLE